MIRKGDKVRIKPQFADPGDDTIVWIAADDEDKGRVTIMADVNLPIKPTQVVRTDMIDPA